MTSEPAARDAEIPSVERISFFEAQARHRVAGRCWSALLGLLLALVVFVSAVLISQPILALGAFLISCTTDLDVFARLGEMLSSASPSLVDYALLVGLGVLPGLVALVALAWRIERIARVTHERTHAQLLGLRDPRPRDLEEIQLRNVIEEMAIAARCAPPALKLIDSGCSNIGLFTVDGRSTVIVTRGLLDALPRAETLALVGLAIAQLGNGDGRLAERVVRLGEIAGGVCALAHWLVSREAREALKPLMAGDDLRASDALVALRRKLAEPMSLRVDATRPGLRGRLHDIAILPLLGVTIVGIGFVPLAWQIGIETLANLVWQRRRLLGDATAVQFSRDPQALAQAHARLSHLDTRIDAAKRAPWLANVFLLDATGARELFSPYPTTAQRIARINAQGAHVDAAALQALAPKRNGKRAKPHRAKQHPSDDLRERPLAQRIAFGVFLAIIFAMFAGFVGTMAAFSFMLSQLALTFPLWLAFAALRGF